MVNYGQSSIYKLVCRDPLITEIYVGSTTNFYQRKSHHKQSCNNPDNKDHNIYVYQFIRDNGGWINWDFIEIEEYKATINNKKYIVYFDNGRKIENLVTDQFEPEKSINLNEKKHFIFLAIKI